MAFASIHNRKGFFSDYWLGTLSKAKGAAGGPKLTAAQLRKALERIRRAVEAVDGLEAPELSKLRERLARPVLQEVFGFSILENPQEPRLRRLCAPSDGGEVPVAMLWLLPEAADLERAECRRRLEDALVAEQLDYGFIVTPEAIRLVRRPGLGARGACWDLSLSSVAELNDGDSLSVAFRVLAAANFVPVAGGRRFIDVLEEESRRHSAKVSDDLKQAVFEAAELVVGGFLRDARERAGAFQPQPGIVALRDAGFLVLYRLLFILYAEARDERIISHRLYQRSYSLDGLVERLLRQPIENLAGNRYGLWAQIQALFRVFNEGIEPHLPELENIPPRGGRLFSDETAEGRLVCNLRLDDRSVGEIMLALATARPRRGVGRERVSFRELDIEQLGNVYQGLLEYEPAEAAQTLIACKVAGRELALTPADLLRLAEQKELAVKGDFSIVEGTEAERLHPDAADDVEEEEEEDDESGEGEEDDKGVKRGAALRLLRRLSPGEFFFKPGAARKASGSYYTPTPIVDYLVREALGPLVSEKSPAEIERLRVIDLACGSAHFLVGAARFLGRALHEAYRREHGDGPPPVYLGNDRVSPQTRARWEREGHDWCKRRIVEHCLFGVDLNPAAVQLAQVALWIESLAGDRPLSFFAHHIRCGNALLGSSLERFAHPPHPSLGGAGDRHTPGLFESELKKRLAAAMGELRLIDAPLPPEIRPDTPQEYAYKEDRLRRAEAARDEVRLLLDLRSASAFVHEIWADLTNLAAEPDIRARAQTRPWWNAFQEIRESERFFHWELEFPDVFADGGFDAVLGNPPWEKVKPDRREFYGRADVLIRAFTGGELDARIRELHALHPELEGGYASYEKQVKTTGQCLKKGGDYQYIDWEIDGNSTGGDLDLFKFFVERSYQVLRRGGRLGYLVPSAIYNNEGCTGLRHLLLDEMSIQHFYAFENRKRIFNIHRSYKFVCLVAAMEQMQVDAPFQAAFMRHDVDELASGGPADVLVPLARNDLERLSPGTLAFLELRDQIDKTLIDKVYVWEQNARKLPLLLELTHPQSWRARTYRQYHMSDDRDLWTDPSGKLFSPKVICGIDYPERGEFEEVRAAMQKKGFWPLYEGKKIDQLIVNAEPIQRWVSLEKAETKFGQVPDANAKVVYRAVARNTDERTMIAAVLPENSCLGHSLIIFESELVAPDLACTILNSFVFDYLVRIRASGINMSASFLSRVAVPSQDKCQLIPMQPTLDNLSAAHHSTDSHWQANWAVAQAYGLSAADLAHILSTFPVFARKHPETYAFFQSRISGMQ